MSRKDQDIRDVMKEEKSRGRKPVDSDAEREIREREAAILKLIEGRDRVGLEEALSLYFSKEEVQEKLRLYDRLIGSG